MNKGYSAELRRDALELLKSGRSVRSVAAAFGVSAQTVYTWRSQSETGAWSPDARLPNDGTELIAARRKIRELEVELAATRRAAELLKEAVPPKARFETVDLMGGEGTPIRVCARVVGVSESGYYAWRRRTPSARSIRHDRLTEAITQVHRRSRAAFGVRRVHACLNAGEGMAVGRSTVELLMARAGLQGATGNPAWRERPSGGGEG
jgi:putative transposase